MRVVFFGTPDFAVPTLAALVQAGHEVALVVSQPDQPAGRGQSLRSPPVVAWAREHGLEVAQPKALRSGPFPERFAGLRPDVAVVIAYGRILPKALLEIPRLGCVNVHASLLPRWRGAAPIQAAVLAGDELTGVCTQRMEEGLDTGPVFVERKTAIGAHETAGELHDRLCVLGAEVAEETLAGLEDRVPVPQDAALATHAPKVEREDGRLSWGRSAVELDRRARAMTPWPGAFAMRGADAVKVLAVRPTDGSGEPGQILAVRPELVVATADGALVLERLQAPGRKPVSGTDYANGAHLSPGGRW